jgi:DNA-binding MarR family transcriptional regulator
VHENLADELFHQLNGVRRTLRRRLRARIDAPLLTPGQAELLRAVEETPGIGVSAVARQLSLAGNSVSTLVNQLLAIGYLRRERDPNDGRAACLYLTAQAARRLARWRADRTRLLTEGLAALSKDDQRAIERALPALDALNKALVKEDI